MAADIPVIDFEAMSLQHEDPLHENQGAIKTLADQVFEAFSTIGFVYLKNHGIPQETIDLVFETFDKFFALSTDVKQRYAKKGKTIPNGWDALEKETNNPDRPGDRKESFDIGYFDDEDFTWPNAEVPDFQSIVSSFYQSVTDLSVRVVTIVAIGLNLVPDYFTRTFQKIKTSSNGTQLRFNCYPPIPDTSALKPAQLRCGEHTDYGAFTVLFQDDAGGLEVRNLDGNFVTATPMKGTVIVNIADLMQRWTADKLKSTVHRVLLPERDVKCTIPRRSLAFFVHPDEETLITCMDGSNKYPPVRAGDWKIRRLIASYKD